MTQRRNLAYAAPAISCLLALAGCLDTELECDPGFRVEGEVCVPVDGGGRDGGGSDSGTDDAGTDSGVEPCGGACSGETSLCRESDDRCVACLGDADCTGAAAARCDTTAGTCEACESSTDCGHLTATPACVTEGERVGECVECLDNDGCGETEGCDLQTNACRPFTADSAGNCAPCVRDAECTGERLCVPFLYDDPRTPVGDVVDTGMHCAWPRDATGAGAPDGSCLAVRPYLRASDLVSADGVAATVCTLRQSTCEAHADFSDVDCMTLDADGDARCGLENVDDGVCRAFDAVANRCTVLCGSDEDCRMGFTCSGDTPGVCEFM